MHAERADLYVYFYARALQLLRQGGMLVFISSNKWLRAGYGANLRGYIAATASVNSVTDFGELAVFQSAATFPMIIVAQKGTSSQVTTFTQVETLDPPYPEVRGLIQQSGILLSADAIQGDKWMLLDSVLASRLRTMNRAGVALSELVKGQIYYGIKTGFDAAFIVDGAKRNELIVADPRNEEIIKPLAVGDNVRRWRINFADKWLLYMYHGIDPKKWPLLIEHLKPHRARLQQRATDQKWFELQQPSVRYAPIYGGPKIVYPEIAKEARFALDATGHFPLKTVFSIPSTDLYLLGVLNSASAWEFLKATCSVLGDAERGGRLLLSTIYVGNLPIPNALAADRIAIADLVQRCLDAKGQGSRVAEWEAEINARVARLYGLPG